MTAALPNVRAAPSSGPKIAANDERAEARPGTRAAELLRALRARSDGKHVVVIRGYPDPDSLASAWAHVRLAASVGVECEIAHLPLVSRAENRAMVKLLELPLVRIAAPEDLDRYSAMSLVDANSIELPKKAGLPCVSIVDHHSLAGPVHADFVDVRASVGSTSTIYTQYLLEARDAIGDNGFDMKLATALAYGIRSDTDDLLRATSADLQSLAALVDRVDQTVLATLSRYVIPASAMSVLQKALGAIVVEGTWAWAGVGAVRPRDRDAIGQAADFLLRRDGIKTVIVFGLVDTTIDGSLRTVDPAVDPASWLRDAFGVGPSGLPYGGGRRNKGGFQIPLGPLASAPDTRALWHVCKDFVEDTIKKALGATSSGASDDELESDEV